MTSPKIVFKQQFQLSLNSPDRFRKISDIGARNEINAMFNYFSNVKKRAINMYDYFQGKIGKEKLVNIVMENGKYATEEELEKRKKESLKYFKNSNIYKGFVSFNNDYIDSSIELSELEKLVVKEVFPAFFRKCGFVDSKKMQYQIAIHTNTNHYHFHYSFMEKEPNYYLSNGKIGYRRRGMINNEEIKFLKNEIIHAIERHKEFTPLVISTNKEIEELKKYFKPGERNFILRNYEDLVLEENILKLGKLLYEKRNGNTKKIKFNSINDKEINKLTKSIKNYLFNNKKSELYKKESEFKDSLNKINDYFYKLNIDNHVSRKKYKSKYVEDKKEYIDNYVFNAIVNNAMYKYSNLVKQNKNIINDKDIIQEAVLKMYRKNKKQSKIDILVNYLSNSNKKNQFKNKYKIEQSIKKINEEMEEATSEFSKLFTNDSYDY